MKLAMRLMLLPGLLFICMTAAQPSRAPISEQAPVSPEAAMIRFVGLNNRGRLGSDEGKALFAGELQGLEVEGSGNLPQADRVVLTSHDQAVARIPASENDRPDLYFYLERHTDSWKIVAYRHLAAVGVLVELRRLLRAQQGRTAEQEVTLRNAELVLAPDARLIMWAKDNQDFLEQVRLNPESAALANVLKEAGGNRIYSEGGIIFVSMGGILDNEVGFFLAPENEIPRISPDRFIWIEPTGTGWHLFKTT